VASGDYHVATAAPELTASRKTYDPYEHVLSNAVPAANAEADSAEEGPLYSVPPLDAAYEENDEEEEGERQSDRRSYLRAVMVGLLVGVLGLAAMSIWHWRGEIRELSSSLSRELSSELAGLREERKDVQAKQSARQDTVTRKQPGHQPAFARRPAEQRAPLLVSASEPVRSESPTLRLVSSSGAGADELKPALIAATVSPMRISVAPRESLQLLLFSVPPIYPRQARERRIEGLVALKAVIGRDGTVTELRIVKGDPQLVPAAVDAVRQWRYRPYLLYGEAREVETTVLVDFSLARE
jgi:TonB family protein